MSDLSEIIRKWCGNVSVLPAFATSIWLVERLSSSTLTPHVRETLAFFKTQQPLQSSFPKPVHESGKSLCQLPSSTPSFPSFFARSLDTMKITDAEWLSEKPQWRLHSHSSSALCRFVVFLVTRSNLNPQSLRPLKEKQNTIPHVLTGHARQCSPCENEWVGQLMSGAR